MKNKWIRALGVLLVLGFAIISCDTPTGGGVVKESDPFAGTWVGQNGNKKFVVSNGSWTEYRISDNKALYRGTYTYSGNTVTGKTTHILGEILNDARPSSDGWVPYADVSNSDKQRLGVTDDILTVTITNNTFSFVSNGVTSTFEKQ